MLAARARLLPGWSFAAHRCKLLHSAARAQARRATAVDEEPPIKFSASAAATSSPQRSLGAGQENVVGPVLYGIMASGIVLTAAIVYSCVTETVDFAAPVVPEVLRGLQPPPEVPR